MLFYKFVGGENEVYGYALVQFLQLDEFRGYRIALNYPPYWMDELKLPVDEFVRVVSFDDEANQVGKDEIDKLLNEVWDIPIPHFDKSMCELGYQFEFVAAKNSSEVDSIEESNRKNPLFEFMLLPGMSTQKIKTIMLEKLNQIPTTGNELVIIDPFIFPKNRDADYENLFIDIINGCQASQLVIYTVRQNVDLALLRRIKTRLNIPVTVYDATNTIKLHDRYWLVKQLRKGITGCSLNGMGKSMSTINRMLKPDIDIINGALNGVSTEIQ